METFKRNIKFKVSLSNGATIYEGKGSYALVKGELAPWLRLKQDLERHGTKITSMSLYHDDGRTWNLPSAGKNPKFRVFDNLPKPIEYKYVRLFARDIEPGAKDEVLVAVEAVYENYTLILFVSEENPDNTWVLVK